MGLVLGMDEAGYGPNLGPLVITVTAWEVPGEPDQFDFWRRLAGALSRNADTAARRNRLHVGDSKAVYSPARGLGPLELSVLSLLAACRCRPATLGDLWRMVRASSADDELEPWFDERGLGLPLPLAACTAALAEQQGRLAEVLAARGVVLRRIACDVVLTGRFNRALASLGTKAEALSRLTLELLRAVWDPVADGPALILADRHGGRAYYHALLADVLDGHLPMCLAEDSRRSCYRVGAGEVRFEVRSERHFPVAVASMISKYVREASMEAFNRFWQTHHPEVRPTKGYPIDARRFRRDIAGAQARLGIPDHILWRER